MGVSILWHVIIVEVVVVAFAVVVTLVVIGFSLYPSTQFLPPPLFLVVNWWLFVV